MHMHELSVDIDCLIPASIDGQLPFQIDHPPPCDQSRPGLYLASLTFIT